MIFKSGIIILSIAIIGLGVGLVMTKKQADHLHTRDTASILDFSNQLATTGIFLEDLRQDNLMLTNNLAATSQIFETTSNHFADLSSQLTDAKTTNEGEQGYVIKLNGHVGVLEPQNKMLNDRAASLSNNIVLLEAQIAATQQQLTMSQTNNVFLAAELEKQLAQKAELECHFNNIGALRAQAKYLTFGF
jgi:chromosome segregation ATPase